MAQGRRAQAALVQDATPGRVLLLALVANLPIFLGFIVLPLLTQDRATSFGAIPYILYGTPIVAIGALGVYFRAPSERRAHRAARIGLLLAGVALLLWGLVLLSVVLARQ
jgi:energy-converting hydrogenase Eha subunit A